MQYATAMIHDVKFIQFIHEYYTLPFTSSKNTEIDCFKCLFRSFPPKAGC